VQRFAAAIRTLGPEYRVYQYLMKQHSPEIGNHKLPFAEE